MNSKSNALMQRGHKLNRVQQEGTNWVLIAGSALLSTLTIKLGFKLTQTFETRRQNAANQDRRSISKKSVGACQVHTNLHNLNQDEEICNFCLSDIVKHPKSLVKNDSDASLPLVEIPSVEPNKGSGSVLWISSPDRLEMPRKPLHHSNNSDSPCVSESGSDVYSKREVIQKQRRQIKRRDEMIMEMQDQITELQNFLNIQYSQSPHLQAQLDCTSRDLFTSEREIQQLRKVIADHCVTEAVSSEKPVDAKYCHQEIANGFTNAYADNINDMEVSCVRVEKENVERERIEMLKKQVQELVEVIEGKDLLLQSYKEQKVELCLKMKELQQKLAAQVPNIL
ncbi:uncharacterized protein LOC141829980 isoform X2 [Curcuma longa]|uniref:uncharacterized protein LOC141829980 isoform X2 n=1 Tax=Curcuma longa TaxID=136217 RepID=UPI003D9DFBFE